MEVCEREMTHCPSSLDIEKNKVSEDINRSIQGIRDSKYGQPQTMTQARNKWGKGNITHARNDATRCIVSTC